MNYKSITIAILAVVLVIGNLWVDRWQKNLYHGDSNGYYLHVVSFFVNQDVGDYDQTITTLQEVNPSSADPREDKFGIRLTEKGRRYIKYTLGVPVMETPFFLLAHAYASLTDKYDNNGWTKPYLFVVGFAIIFYVLAGLYLLMSVLERYFSKRAVVLTAISLVIATNLFYQCTYVTMSHGFLFFQHALLIYLSARFWDKPSAWRALGVGATVGLIALTRVPEVIAILVPVLWGITSWKSLQERVVFFFKNWNFTLLAAIGLVVVFSLQICYWYYVSGHLVFNPYKGEGFDFTKPEIFRAWIDYNNGWLVYTPIMVFSLIGLFMLRRFTKIPFWPICTFVLLHCWVHYSYYVWNYFPGLGQRPMVDTYPLLSFPFAAAFAVLLDKSWGRWIPYMAILVFGILNLFQTWQSKEGLIWSERHNGAFYWTSFGQTSSSLNALRAYDSDQIQPQDWEIQPIKILAKNDFEQLVGPDTIRRNNAQVHSGDWSYYSPEEFYTLVEAQPLGELEAGAWLRLSIRGYQTQADYPAHRDYCINLVTQIFDDVGGSKVYAPIKITTHFGNPTFNIWTSGAPDVWDEASYFVRIPKEAKAGWTAKVFLFNPHGHKVYLDDFEMAYYEGI